MKRTIKIDNTRNSVRRIYNRRFLIKSRSVSQARVEPTKRNLTKRAKICGDREKQEYLDEKRTKNKE